MSEHYKVNVGERTFEFETRDQLAEWAKEEFSAWDWVGSTISGKPQLQRLVTERIGDFQQLKNSAEQVRSTPNAAADFLSSIQNKYDEGRLVWSGSPRSLFLNSLREKALPAEELIGALCYFFAHHSPTILLFEYHQS